MPRPLLACLALLLAAPPTAVRADDPPIRLTLHPANSITYELTINR